ncbi:MAG TPA: tRNA lysidine(34) synthetase TilS [Burkholderiales bacterium]|nr:tRNA lysidine(34) synthetase TilS [Burkholderiales bacterium]
MASSRKSNRSKPADLPARVAERIGDILEPSTRVVVGLSGGVDSVVLLDCLHVLSRKLGFRMAALHVNHQLSPSASRWTAFCRALCRARGIPFVSEKVTVPRGAELETAARAVRHDVFARQDCDYVALAHHRDDQVETLLLQLLRGAGVKGLAAMPLARKAEGGRRKAEVPPPAARHSSPSILRPLLDVTREEILAYARGRGLKWIEDESNLDTRLRRNFLRHEILPAIARRFPSYRVTLARSAGHLAEASGLLDELAAKDGAAALREGTLAVAALRRLTGARARNLLRFFLAEQGVEAPSTVRLEEALRQSLAAKQDARVSIDLGGAKLMRHAGKLHVVRGTPLPAGYSRRWRGETKLALPEGVLSFTRARGAGIDASRLRGTTFVVRPRVGGERLQPDRRRPRRSLKNLLQEARIPPWTRERMPLLFCGKDLVWAAGIGIDCSFQARKGAAGLLPRWSPSVTRP